MKIRAAIRFVIVGMCFLASTRVGVAGDSANPQVSFLGSDQFGNGSTIPVAWGDYDNDGDLDLAVGNFNEANELYINNGDCTFVQSNAFGAGGTFAVVWGDYDNDGDIDLAVGNNGQNLIFESNGNGGFSQRNEFGTGRTIALAWGDYDNDGDLDMAVGNGILGVAEQNYLYVNNGNDTFTQQPQFGTGQTDSLAWGDYDDDGDLDLAVGNGGFGSVGQNFLYINNADGTFTEQAQFGLGDTAAVAWGDADGDGRLDLAVGNWNAGQSMLYVNNGDGTFAAQAQFGARDTNTVAWGDHDHDGSLDLAVGNGDFSSAEQNYLYVNNGGGSFTELAEFGLGSTDSLAWGDCDGDGDLDMAVGNEHSPTQNRLYQNLLNDGAYLRLDLVGRFHQFGGGFSNRGGVGARVYVYEDGQVGDLGFLLGFQQVEAKGGFSAQNAMALTIGVPSATHADVEIRWPGSGGTSITQRLIHVAVGGKLIIRESMADCGDGVVDTGEECDIGITTGQPGACPTDCTTGDPCVAGTLVEAGACWATCQNTTITYPTDGDGCCPAGANAVSDDDCAPVCGNGVCEAGEDVTCIADCQCGEDAQCDDSYICTFDHCQGGLCTYSPNKYGDIDGNTVVTLADLFCVLDGFQGDFSSCSFAQDDIHGSCGDGINCCPNGVISLADLFAVLDAYQGEDPCCGQAAIP